MLEEQINPILDPSKFASYQAKVIKQDNHTTVIR